jgi:two-component system chemotaxis sensor kinase CheA/two-component system sensor histidine kinase and response regulator WspE
MSNAREALLARFRGGLRERLRVIQALVSSFEAARDESELQAALGELHTLKGEARMLGLAPEAELTNALESELSSGKLRVPLVLRALEAILHSIDLTYSPEHSAAELAGLLRELEQVTAGDEGEPAFESDGAAAPVTPAEPHSRAARLMQVEASVIDGLCEHIAELMAAFGQLESTTLHGLGRAASPMLRAELSEQFERFRSLLDRTTDSAWTLRLVPLEPLLHELARSARISAERQGKAIEVSVAASGVQLERDVADQLWDSLVHLVQNAVDHGASDDLHSGRALKLWLVAESSGPNVLLRVTDSGRGIDAGEVRKLAVERGFVSELAAAKLDDQAALELLFEHGFSTRRQAGMTSGRGVGLDVVRRRLESLGGRATLESQLGQGTRFTLSVPFAITKEKVLAIDLGGVPYALPSRVVRAVLGPEALPGAEQDRVVRHAGETLPFRSLNEALGLAQEHPDGFVLVLELSNRRYAAGVTGVLGERELVRRPAEKLLHNTGIGASAVLEDGRVALLPELNFVQRSLRTRSASEPSQQRGEMRPKVQRVLVVDDSPVVRELVTEILESAGLHVERAADGAAALEMILQREPDLVVTDVEMPRMNGFELLAEVRRRTQRLPVVMLTTRGSIEDRKRATQHGANAYLIKAEFHSERLLDVVRRFVQVSGA